MNLEGLLSLRDLERAVREALDPAVWAYVAGGAGEEATVRANEDAYGAVWLAPRVLDSTVQTPSTGTRLFEQELAMPVLLAPTSPQRLLHSEAELATARAARKAGVPCIVSTDSHYPFRDVAANARGPWFQLYPYRSRDTVKATIDLAISAGAGALVLTADANFSARRLGAQRAGFRTPPGVDFGTLRSLGVLSGEIPAEARLERLPMSWNDLAWMRGATQLPLLVKGVLRVDDARRCVEMGVDGIIVSNHGGRQLDSAVPSLVALERIAAEVGGRTTVIADGGVRSGVDVVKALALGAHAVCVGRPYLWGLAAGGETGVAFVLSLLRKELEDTLLQLGLGSVSHIDRNCVERIRWEIEAPLQARIDSRPGAGGGRVARALVGRSP